MRRPACLAALAAALTVLCACDPPPRIRVINGATDFVWLSNSATPERGRRHLPRGGAAVFSLYSQGSWPPTVGFHGCSYAYADPGKAGDMPGRPGSYIGIGQWSSVQVGEDLRVYVRDDPHARRAASTAGLLATPQPPGWPLAPLRKTCR
jgi:hypothetical protein